MLGRFLYMLSPMALAMLLAMLHSAAALAQPDPGTSTFERVIGMSPKNNCVGPAHRYRYTGTLLDAVGVPVEGFPAAEVVLHFDMCLEPTTRPITIAADHPSSPTGLVVWDVSLAHGGADPCEVEVFVGGVLFYTLPGHVGLPNPQIDGGIRSPDANGDGVIALPDLSTWQQEFINTGVRRDYLGDLARPFDGLTSLVDLGTFQAHFVCP
jgi:hypothetical protein